MRELLTLSITTAGALFNAWYDARLIKAEKYIYSHFLRMAIRGLCIVAMVAFIIPTYSIFQELLAMAILAVWFWIVFDLSINHFLNKYPLRIGKTSKLDKLLQHLGEYYAFAVKIALLIALSIAYLIHYDTLFY